VHYVEVLAVIDVIFWTLDFFHRC